MKLQALPTELLAMIARHLDRPGLCQMRFTMNTEVVSKTVDEFAKKTFRDEGWYNRMMSRRTLEELEEVARRPHFVPYVDVLDFRLDFLDLLTCWACNIKTEMGTNESAEQIPTSLRELQLFTRNERLFWDKPESWTRVSKLFKGLHALRQITAHGSFGTSHGGPYENFWHGKRELADLQARLHIKQKPPRSHMVGEIDLRYNGVRLIVAIRKSGLRLQHTSLPAIALYNIDFFDQLVKFDWLAIGYPEKVDDLATVLNQLMSFMPKLRELTITSNDRSVTTDLNLKRIMWPKTLARLSLWFMVILEDQLEGFSNLPTSMISLHLCWIVISETEEDDDVAEWFSELGRQLPSHRMLLNLSELWIDEEGQFFSFPLLRGDKRISGVRNFGYDDDGEDLGDRSEVLASSGEEYSGEDMAGYFRSIKERIDGTD